MPLSFLRPAKKNSKEVFGTRSGHPLVFRGADKAVEIQTGIAKKYITNGEHVKWLIWRIWP